MFQSNVLHYFKVISRQSQVTDLHLVFLGKNPAKSRFKLLEFANDPLLGFLSKPYRHTLHNRVVYLLEDSNCIKNQRGAIKVMGRGDQVAEGGASQLTDQL